MAPSLAWAKRRRAFLSRRGARGNISCLCSCMPSTRLGRTVVLRCGAGKVLEPWAAANSCLPSCRWRAGGVALGRGGAAEARRAAKLYYLAVRLWQRGAGHRFDLRISLSAHMALGKAGREGRKDEAVVARASDVL